LYLALGQACAHLITRSADLLWLEAGSGRL